MSLGHIGYCKKDAEDSAAVFYAYSGADWGNKTQSKADETAFDGTLAIDKTVLQWKPSKPRKQTESLGWTRSAIENGQAVVLKECRNAFRRFNPASDIDYIALRLLCKIFEYLHETGKLPDKESFIQ